MDVTGKPTLLVYKAESTYRINDSTSGSYTTLHSRGAGAAGHRCVASVLGRICSINRSGIWVTDGIAIPQRVSDKLTPFFSADGLNLGLLANWSAAAFTDRIVFSVTRAGKSTNDLLFEYHPAIGWTVPHKFTIGPMALYTKQANKLMGAASNSGKVFQMFTGGTDDGAAIPASYQTPWLVLNRGDEARLRQLRIYGRGTAGLSVRQDFGTLGDSYTLNFSQGFGYTWDVDRWDEGAWGDPAFEGNADQPLDQVCKHVSLVFSNSTSTSTFRPALLGDGNTPEVGAWGVYEAKLDYIQLGT
jgi:hypothetical protein